LKIKGGVTCCPHCGDDEQFYVRLVVSGTTSEFFTFDGGAGDNTHMWDYVKTKNQKTAFCGTCQKRIGTVED
jgi:hypothetical protein